MTFREDALAGEHVVISGGVGAIGLHIVKTLTEHGAVMCVNDLVPPSEGEARLREFGINLERVRYHQHDLSIPEAAAQFIDDAKAHFGTVTTALCHAGIVISGALLDFSADDFDKTMNTNVKTAFLLGQAAARQMVADGIAGHLIFTTSWVAETPWPGIGPYNTSKAAMNQLMRSFARELAPQQVRANALAPGIVAVGMAKRQYETEPDYRARADRAIPLGYMQPPETVADAMLFLCSPAAHYMTGAVLTVDGGCSLYPMD